MTGKKHRDFDWLPSRIVIFGTGGSGKTTKGMALLKQKKARVVFIFDHKQEFAKRLGKKAVFTLEEIITETARGGYVIFDPCEMFPGEKEAAFDFFCNYVYDVSGHFKGRKIFVCDELQMFMSSSMVPKSLMLILDDGRNFQLDALLICHAGNSIHNRVKNQILEAYTFRQSDENAVKFLTANGYKEDEIRNLKPGEYIYRNFSTGETTKGGKAFRIE